MPTFILMTKLGQHAMHDAPGRRAMGRAWLEKVKAQVPGVRFVSHYAIFGPYDFLDIFETDDVEAAQRVALISRAEGAVSVETWGALPYDQFLQLLERVEGEER
jgi:uncharacterized protein with GYD domain